MKSKKEISATAPLSERSFLTIFEQSPVSTQIFSPDGVTIKVNKAYEKLWGVSFEQVKDYNVLKDKQLVKAGVARYIKRGFKGEALVIPTIKYVPNDTIPGLTDVPFRYTNAIIYPVRDKDGRISEVVLMHQDVTEQKLSEDKLAESEARYRNLVNLAPDVIYSISIDGKIMSLSSKFEQVTGYQVKQWIGKYFGGLVHSEDIGIATTNFKKSISGEEVVPYVLRIKTKSRGYYVGEFRTGPFFKDGKIIGQIGISRDITERRIIEETLYESEERFRMLANAMPQQVWTALPDGKLDYVNEKVIEYFDLPFEKIIGDGWQDKVHADDLTLSLERWRKSVKNNTPYEVEFRLRKADGEYFWHVARALPSFDDDGKIVKWFGTNTDITDRVEMEIRKDEFISMASHELKTPVTSLKLHTQLLERHIERDVGNPLFDQSLTKMNEQINRLTILINDLLDLSKITAGKLEYRDEIFDLEDLVRDTVLSMQAITPTYIIKLKGHLVKKARGDKERINQVIINLLSNAIKYSPDSKKVSVTFEETEKSVGVAVADLGIGIAKEHQGKIFGRFYQVGTPNEKTYPGLGIGLYICNEIITRHGGKMKVESSPSKGSTFSFSIPFGK